MCMLLRLVVYMSPPFLVSFRPTLFGYLIRRINIVQIFCP